MGYMGPGPYRPWEPICPRGHMGYMAICPYGPRAHMGYTGPGPYGPRACTGYIGPGPGLYRPIYRPVQAYIRLYTAIQALPQAPGAQALGA